MCGKACVFERIVIYLFCMIQAGSCKQAYDKTTIPASTVSSSLSSNSLNLLMTSALSLEAKLLAYVKRSRETEAALLRVYKGGAYDMLTCVTQYITYLVNILIDNYTVNSPRQTRQ